MKKVLNFKKIKECLELADDVEISDGNNTFLELYEHRDELFIQLCHQIYLVYFLEEDPSSIKPEIWRSCFHSDGSSFGGDWFILGINKEKGKQITYLIPINRWNNCDFAETLDKAPEYDGHTSQDVLNRIRKSF